MLYMCFRDALVYRERSFRENKTTRFNSTVSFLAAALAQKSNKFVQMAAAAAAKVIECGNKSLRFH